MDHWKAVKTKAREATVVAGIGAVGLGVDAASEAKNLQDLLDHETRSEFVAISYNVVTTNSTSENGADVSQPAAKAGKSFTVSYLETTLRSA